MTTRARPQLVLLPLYAASAVLTLGEGSVALLLPPYLHRHGIHAATIGAIVSVYGVASLASRIPAGSLYRSHRAAAIIAGGCAMSSLAFFAIPLTGHPVVLGRSAWASVPDEGARALQPVLVPCDDLDPPGDVDRPEDLPERLR